jgi:hypothetical protein
MLFLENGTLGSYLQVSFEVLVCGISLIDRRCGGCKVFQVIGHPDPRDKSFFFFFNPEVLSTYPRCRIEK